ncbi:hypothetical protein chiPu_0024305 [Chiloscyllium punctatum]|uniref:RRM domain-containing protein n=1 Tax=Chiloscyllium punctatum TaxID=137246 RepID=A0A401TBZ5_CHIPU|nr:hypothetical protein [Chiloscyllium punctatum]
MVSGRLTTVFVRNLPKTAVGEQLEKIYSELGPIKHCFVVNEKGEGRGRREEGEHVVKEQQAGTGLTSPGDLAEIFIISRVNGEVNSGFANRMEKIYRNIKWPQYRRRP